MLNKRRSAVAAAQRSFRDAWYSADRSALDAANCIAEMLRLRSDANLPIAIGTDLLDTIVLALNASIEARKRLIQAHELTPTVIKQLGLARMFGDVSPCPPTDRGAKLIVLPEARRSADRSGAGE